MQLALNGATIMHSPLAGDVEVAAAAGFSALEIWAGKLPAYEREHTLADLRQQLRGASLQPWCINSIEDITFRDAAGRRSLLAELRGRCDAARAIGAPSIVVVPGTAPAGALRADCIADAADVLAAMSDVAEDISLAFEFLGKPGCVVPTLDMAIEVVERVDRANVGMVIDTFHFHAGGSRIEDIARVPVEKLLVLHVNGCEDVPQEQATDAHRLYPGEGVIDTPSILQALRQRGFDGVASVEIFRPEYWEQDAAIVARTARARAAEVLSRAGYRVEAGSRERAT